MTIPKIDIKNITNLSEQKNVLKFLAPVILLLAFILILISLTFFSGGKSPTQQLTQKEQSKGDKSFTNSINQSYDSNPTLKIVANVPYADSAKTFSVDYDGTDNIIVVKLVGPDKTIDKQNANKWITSLGVDLTKVNVYYN